MLLATTFFLPFVAVSYRRYGNLTFARSAMWLAGLVYFCALWSYTLLPLPDSEHYKCAIPNLDIMKFVVDLRNAAGFTDPLFLQLALNVLLFVPLGFLVRMAGKRGVFTAALIGFVVSAFIEVTQLTGVGGVFPCAYRVFDVDDMLTNTSGAILGSLIALVSPSRARTPMPDYVREPVPVTRGRRFVGAVCDLLSVIFVGAAVAVAVRIWLKYIVQDQHALLNSATTSQVGSLVAFAICFLFVMFTGSTIGDYVVDIRYQGGRIPGFFVRLIRFFTGIGGVLVLSYFNTNIFTVLFCAVSLVVLVATNHGKGIPGLLTGSTPVDNQVHRTGTR